MTQSPTPPFLTRVRIKNYKSIKACDVKLGSLAFLVGPNGSGKSNFLDALRFIADMLSEPSVQVDDPEDTVVGITPGVVPDTSLGHALSARGGINLVRRQLGGPRFAIRIDFQLPDGTAGHYAFEVGLNESAQRSQQAPQFTVHHEECSVGGAAFHIDETTPDDFPPPPFRPDTSWPGVDRSQLYLHQLALFAGGRPELQPFQNIHSALLRMRSYNLNPDAMRKAHTPDPTGLLQHDGGNLWPTLKELETRSPETLERIQQYLGLAVPSLASLALFSMEPTSASHAEFQQEFPNQAYPRKLPARSMSDGTLRALGILTALLQEDASGPPSLITIEEPEMALHPAAVDILIGAIHDARERTQVLVTTHSPELLHSDEVKSDELLAVEAEKGATTIGCVDEGSRRVLSDRLFTAGELLSLNQLEPDKAACETASRTLDFFDAKA